MRVEVKLFGAEAHAAGAGVVSVDLDVPATCGTLRDVLRATAPTLASSLGWARFAVNGHFANDDTPIDEADELAIIGLVSGG